MICCPLVVGSVKYQMMTCLNYVKNCVVESWVVWAFWWLCVSTLDVHRPSLETRYFYFLWNNVSWITRLPQRPATWVSSPRQSQAGCSERVLMCGTVWGWGSRAFTSRSASLFRIKIDFRNGEIGLFEGHRLIPWWTAAEPLHNFPARFVTLWRFFSFFFLPSLLWLMLHI